MSNPNKFLQPESPRRSSIGHEALRQALSDGGGLAEIPDTLESALFYVQPRPDLPQITSAGYDESLRVLAELRQEQTESK